MRDIKKEPYGEPPIRKATPKAAEWLK